MRVKPQRKSLRLSRNDLGTPLQPIIPKSNASNKTTSPTLPMRFSSVLYVSPLGTVASPKEKPSNLKQECDTTVDISPKSGPTTSSKRRERKKKQKKEVKKSTNQKAIQRILSEVLDTSDTKDIKVITDTPKLDASSSSNALSTKSHGNSSSTTMETPVKSQASSKHSAKKRKKSKKYYRKKRLRMSAASRQASRGGAESSVCSEEEEEEEESKKRKWREPSISDGEIAEITSTAWLPLNKKRKVEEYKYNVTINLEDGPNGTIIIPSEDEDETETVTTPIPSDRTVTVPSNKTVIIPSEDEDETETVTTPIPSDKTVTVPSNKIVIIPSEDRIVTAPSDETVTIPGEDGTVTVLSNKTITVPSEDGDGTITVPSEDGDGTVTVLSDDDDNDVIVLGSPAVPSVRGYKAVISRNKTPVHEMPRRPDNPHGIIARAIAQMGERPPLPSPAAIPLISPASVNGGNLYNPRGRPEKKGLRPIIIDASNVAMGHGKRRVFSCRGIEICVNYFLKRKHKVYAFLPRYRRHSIHTKDAHLLDRMEAESHVIYTPSRNVDGRSDVPYDDRYIVQTAAELGGVIVSTDNYRDLLQENPHWHDTIKNRLLMFTWVEDMLIFPQDPLGRRGAKLDEFLRF